MFAWLFLTIYMFKKKNKVVWGWLRLPLLLRQSKQTLPRSNIKHTRKCNYIQVLVVSCAFRKSFFFLHFSGNVDQVYCCWMQQYRRGQFASLFQSCAANKSGIHYTFWQEKKSSFLKHDAIPTICPASGNVEEGTWKT